MIKDLVNGATGVANFYCQKVTAGTTKTNKPFQSVVLRDYTGTIDGKVWEVSQCEMTPDNYYRIKYTVQEYNGALQLTVQQREELDKATIDVSQFNPTSKYNVSAMFNDIVRILQSIENPWLKKILALFLHDDDALKAYKDSSAAVKVHHAFVGGLVQHTRGILKMACQAAEVYEGVDRDLLLTAAFFHDVGKIKELAPFPQNSFTAYGVMIGHVTLSTITIENLCTAVEGFPAELKYKLMHCVLSHHGELEYGSPVKPALREAIILSQLDNLDAKLEVFEEAADGNGGYVHVLGTTVLKEEEFKCLEQD